MVLGKEDAYIRDLQYGVRGTGYGVRGSMADKDSTLIIWEPTFAIRVARAPRHPGRVLDIWRPGSLSSAEAELCTKARANENWALSLI